MLKKMPKYEHHIEIRALKIRDVKYSNTDGSAVLYPEDLAFASFKVDGYFTTIHNPQPGGYYIEDADGKASFVRESEFHEMYRKI